ncbi:MAG: AAA family ATPase [Actinomycetota bacterium]|nr:AAA family ATPase [Actinomycetota bacterium]
MALCPSCGEQNSAKAKFCSECATPLIATPTPEAEERKVVSILFVDLVGFTARSHDADPEDVRAALKPYHERLKQESERFGGTVEKFIGDAVMTVFGAPIAHEDDAERAVRAALRITEAIEEMNENDAPYELAIRGAVNTGEVLVSLSEEMGQGLVGDVVNTASRLQGVAPVNGIVVGEATYRATRDVIDYEPLEAVTVKGKPQPLPIWRVIAARSRFGVDVDMAPKTPFIGRDFDLAALRNTFQRTLRESSVQLVTITGEPGVGKTRLLSEFSSFIDDQNDLVYWRQGRSLPYGDGITFWALGEIIKAQAGILESDSPETASVKLGIAAEAVVEDTDECTWVVARLGPLVGVRASGSDDGIQKDESFTAWTRFLEAIAARNPLVVVFEDLHWADAAMLKFIDHLVEWSDGVPLLVICTARPELYENNPGWGGGKRNSTTIALSSLSDSETATLISALLSQALLPVEIHTALLERAGGNPLYAEEFIRMLWDRGILRRRGRVPTIDPDACITIPDTIHALIAGRLDTLPMERKAPLHDAAVAGKVFWSGAVSALSGLDDREVREGLHELSRKELVRPARNSSMEGQLEYSFWHALVRDVAYGQIPRSARGRKHRAMAVWIEGCSGDRVSDHSEVLAHHYTQALALARAAGDVEVENLLEPTRRFLILAGDRALELDAAKASSYFRQALELLPSGHPERAPTLVKAGTSTAQEGALDESEHYYEAAIAEAKTGGDTATQGEAMISLASLCWWKGDARRESLRAEAIEILERQPPVPELAYAYAGAAQSAFFSGQPQLALEWSGKALALAQHFGDERQIVFASGVRGGARCDLGDLGGLEELQSAVRHGLKLGLGEETTHRYSLLAEWTWWIEGTSSAARVYEDFIQFAERRGLLALMMHGKAEFLRVLFDLGAWDQIVGSVGDFLHWSEAHGDHQSEVTVLFNQAQVLWFRGRIDQAVAIQGRLLVLAREIGDLQVLVPALAVASLIDQTRGNTKQAVALVAELDYATREHHGWRVRYLPTIVRILVSADQVDKAERFLAGMEVNAARDQHSLLTGHAIVTEATGLMEEARDLYREAVQRWTDYGFVLEEGQAHLGLARCLINLGDRAAATEPLQKARAIFTKLQARPLTEEVDRHLEQAVAL